MSVRIGVQLGPAEPDAPDLATVAQAVESHGFESLWLGEHLLWRRPFLDPLAACAFAAAATTRLRLGTSVLILPLHHPLRLATTVSTVDRLSAGRFELGVGIGGENPAEFAAMGVPVRERGRRADETLPLLRQLFAGGPVDYSGPTGRLAGAQLNPPPLTPGGPPIWVAGRSAAAPARAARFGDGWLPYLITPQRLAVGVAELRERAAAVGRPCPQVGVHLFVSIGAPRAAAGALAELLGRLYGLAPDAIPYDRCLVGPPEAVLDRAHEYLAAGATRLLLQPIDPAGGLLAGIAELAAHLREPLSPSVADPRLSTKEKE